NCTVWPKPDLNSGLKRILSSHILLEIGYPRPIDLVAFAESHRKGINIGYAGNCLAFGNRPSKIEAMHLLGKVLDVGSFDIRDDIRPRWNNQLIPAGVHDIALGIQRENIADWQD